MTPAELEANCRAAPVFAGRTELLQLAASVTPDAGAVMEFGVYSTASIRVLADAMPSRDVHGFDSFEGLPEAWEFGATRVPEGHFRRHLPTDLPRNVKLWVGLFADTLPKWRSAHQEQCALVHIDCDLYSSARTVLAGLADRLQPGAVLIFDELMDFGGRYPQWRGGEWRALIESGIACRPIGRTSLEQVALQVTG